MTHFYLAITALSVWSVTLCQSREDRPPLLPAPPTAEPRVLAGSTWKTLRQQWLWNIQSPSTIAINDNALLTIPARVYLDFTIREETRAEHSAAEPGRAVWSIPSRRRHAGLGSAPQWAGGQRAKARRCETNKGPTMNHAHTYTHDQGYRTEHHMTHESHSNIYN